MEISEEGGRKVEPCQLMMERMKKGWSCEERCDRELERLEEGERREEEEELDALELELEADGPTTRSEVLEGLKEEWVEMEGV